MSTNIVNDMTDPDTTLQQDLTEPLVKPDTRPHSACHLCGQPRHEYWQPGAQPNSGSWDGHCLNKSCVLEYITLRIGDHEKLSPEQIEKYAATKARAALDQARCILSSRQYIKNHPLKDEPAA